ncbi:MAG: cytochrome c [Chlamydiales bacterium]
MRYRNFYQYSLIFFALLVIFAVGIFVYKEIFPQYKKYQYVYKDVEKFRSSITGERPTPFDLGIKQILIPDPENGPELIDRCTSCHLAMNLPHFSPTRVALDVNDNPIIDADARPVLEPNPDYIWEQIDAKIAALTHTSKRKAEKLASLKNMEVEGRVIDVQKVLMMHPLIGAETTPFQYHPMEDYGCTSCHSGNGRALVVDRAHGPVYDEMYEAADRGPQPEFLEKDPLNDPKFARMYNSKPGHQLIFQTTPLLIGPLMEAKCMQCHHSSKGEWQTAMNKIVTFESREREKIKTLEEGSAHQHAALAALLNLGRLTQQEGIEKTQERLKRQLQDYSNLPTQIDAYEGQIAFLNRNAEEGEIATALLKQTAIIAGDQAEELLLAASKAKDENETAAIAQEFFEKHSDMLAVHRERREQALHLFTTAKEPLMVAGQDEGVVALFESEVDRLTTNYQRGKELYVSQACYACHRIAGFSRSSVGPELTRVGLNYPWFVKESITWPQADLPSSTMPNFHLDHEELQDLMTFLMAQTGKSKAISEVDDKIALQQWEAGEKLFYENPIPPTDIQNLHYGMMVYATEGCASCHKLEGFTSQVEIKSGNEEWFFTTFSERMLGSKLAEVVVNQGEEIDLKITTAKEPQILEELEQKYPGLVFGFYPNFKYASRAHNHRYKGKELDRYQERLHKVLMVYIQQYGLGRDIAPPLNWSGVYRDNAWLMGHFHNPAAYTARSLMPVMPFDDTKFYALNYMLHVLGKQNRVKFQSLWAEKGFSPPQAFQLLCATCHGEQRQGNGIIAQWLYPIPKNLKDPIFLRNLTKERAIDSITHGVDGTPMPPWGEAVHPVLTHTQIVQLVDWLYQGLPEQPRVGIKEDYGKWRYSPKNIVEEMVKENELLAPLPSNGASAAEMALDYFETRPNPVVGSDKELYYIRDIYYTRQNLDEIRPYYNVNCAVCHGKEGTGAGLRATSMAEAKPRMFTNLPWIQTRDDLRLLRSIKYGVPGTAMTPWGDQSTAKQRMQLTLLIRSFTRAAIQKEKLERVLFAIFDERIIALEEERIPNYRLLEKMQEKYKALEEKSLQEAAPMIYQDLFAAKKEMSEKRSIDQEYLGQIAKLREMREIFLHIGSLIIAKGVPETVITSFYSFIKQFMSNDPKATIDPVFHYLDERIAAYQKELDEMDISAKAPLEDKEVQAIITEQSSFIDLRSKIVQQLVQARHILEQFSRKL